MLSAAVGPSAVLGRSAEVIPHHSRALSLTGLSGLAVSTHPELLLLLIFSFQHPAARLLCAPPPPTTTPPPPAVLLLLSMLPPPGTGTSHAAACPQTSAPTAARPTRCACTDHPSPRPSEGASRRWRHARCRMPGSRASLLCLWTARRGRGGRSPRAAANRTVGATLSARHSAVRSRPPSKQATVNAVKPLGQART
jgi:hypothetical protein